MVGYKTINHVAFVYKQHRYKIHFENYIIQLVWDKRMYTILEKMSTSNQLSMDAFEILSLMFIRCQIVVVIQVIQNFDDVALSLKEQNQTDLDRWPIPTSVKDSSWLLGLDWQDPVLVLLEFSELCVMKFTASYFSFRAEQYSMACFRYMLTVQEQLQSTYGQEMMPAGCGADISHIDTLLMEQEILWGQRWVSWFLYADIVKPCTGLEHVHLIMFICETIEGVTIWLFFR